ncbi:uncharacterized protein LOC123315846 [Coccinella septempunctata]|uniref:uncharacterized protein LOC123315846 n=1 Tax=Coccinella septempunctata TaxID=41139 RepID=UPI001D084130|nr:uncharacterized protein LOC123315846 [Coccinella septempunctata]
MMVVLDDTKETFIFDEINDEELREERRRTGRYVATGTAIFLSLLGLNQSLARGNPEYAALFLPALIMFFYVLWRIRKTNKDNQEENPPNEIQVIQNIPIHQPDLQEPQKEQHKKNSFRRNSKFMFSRSYSVA